jgi:ABC-2 type transport system permease protein
VTLWRLEFLRLFRTMRWIGLLASYLAFGILGPILTRYQEQIFQRLGGGLTIKAPTPTPGLAITAYLGNASQIGLLVTVFIAAGSLAFDAKPEWAAFLRTRARSLGDVVVPKVAVMAAAASVSFALGAVAAWVGTTLLIDDVPADAMIVGILAWTLYLAFAVSMVALAAGVSRSVVGAAGLTVVVLLVLPVIAQVFPVLAPWSPSTLVGAIVEMVDGASATDFLRAAAVAAGLTVGSLWGSVRLLARREV